MIIQRTVNHRGAEYLYFFCRNRQKKTCQAPHIDVALIEDAVERHHATIRFDEQFTAYVRGRLAAAVGHQHEGSGCSVNR